MAKRLIKTVDLRFFQDDTTGEWGLCHSDTQDENTSFNAFWNGIGIFHDVFEHSHEHQNKYFRGDYAMNVGGEMAAMGAMWYYYNVLGVYNRIKYNGWNTPGDSMKNTTLYEVQEAITEGYCNFGYTLESNVPKQNPVYDSELEYQIEDFWKQVKATQTETEYEQEREDAITYKKSVTFRKIADLHRYGFRMAEKMVKDCNAMVLVDFIEVWEKFCKANNAEEMAKAFRGVTVKLYKDELQRITWTATLLSGDRFKFNDVKLTAETIERFYIEDAYTEMAY